ncbi:ArnT family glycosyltransferase [Tunturiibacter lichenicola]|uniref:ArnT family glycosyltransferase n=1 Tax=Tunturiibacter lichenicola TaxID=2051959 RepID=UPI003D9BD3EF
MNQQRPNSSRTLQVIEAALLLLASIFFILHAFHLNADFPNHSPWMDWAKYTDEGWYGDGAIRHFQRGYWYVPGDFNPAAALPVWPLLEAALFRFTGVNLVAARALTVAIFGLILATSYLLLRRWQNLSNPDLDNRNNKTTLAPAIAVLLLAVSPFCYAFTRLAILEPLLVLFTLLALLVASYVTPGQGIAIPIRASLGQIAPILALGLILPLMVLTKTTAVFLLPAIAWILWARAGYRLRPFLHVGIPVVALAAVIWLAYYGFIVRPHFLDDYRYLFSANGYTGVTPSTALSVLGDTIADGLWIGNILYPLGLLAAASALFLRPRLLRNPLIPALLLWAAGYAAFLAYHNNLQPRYYLVIAIPLTLLIPVVFSSLWEPFTIRPGNSVRNPLRGLAGASITVVLTVLIVADARQTLHYVRNPDYTFTSAAAQIHQIVAADRRHNPLILSISGSNLSLMTGLPSICDDFGTMDLAVRVQAYHPGWYVAWNQVDDDKMDALTPMYHLQRVAAFPAMDDPERNLLILYRLDPAIPGTPPRHRRKPIIPRLLQTNFGQQPSQIQLEH